MPALTLGVETEAQRRQRVSPESHGGYKVNSDSRVSLRAQNAVPLACGSCMMKAQRPGRVTGPFPVSGSLQPGVTSLWRHLRAIWTPPPPASGSLRQSRGIEHIWTAGGSHGTHLGERRGRGGRKPMLPGSQGQSPGPAPESQVSTWVLDLGMCVQVRLCVHMGEHMFMVCVSVPLS